MMEFRPKTDRFFIALISAVSLVILAVFTVPLLLDEERTAAVTAVLLTLCALSVGFVLWIPFTVRYVFFPDHLYVRGGPFRSRIPYGEITRVAPLKEIFTGYRLLTARDGIEIFYRSALPGSVKISPRDAERFLSGLGRRCPRAQFAPDFLIGSNGLWSI
jgi:hypothetical protein